MQRLVILVALLCPGLLQASEPRTPKDLIGVWMLKSVQTQGQMVPPEKMSFEFHFTQTQLIWRFVGNVSGPDQVYDCMPVASDGIGKIDFASVSEDVSPNDEPLHIRAIYKQDGDKLLICSMRRPDMKPAEQRPDKFESTKEQRTDLMILERKSPAN